MDLERSSDPTTLEADLPLTSVHTVTDPDQPVHIPSTEAGFHQAICGP